jgi:type II secretory pathway pseudopilin PulG
MALGLTVYGGIEMSGWWGRRGLAFSLLEMVFVVAIVAILAAVALPRVGRGARGAADGALTGNLCLLRGAIDHNAAEHGGSFPQWNKFADQLTTCTDSAGQARAGRDATHIWGPYLRAVPPLPVGENKGETGVKKTDADKVGWIYDETTGDIRANCPDTEIDGTGKKYRDY